MRNESRQSIVWRMLWTVSLCMVVVLVAAACANDSGETGTTDASDVDPVQVDTDLKFVEVSQEAGLITTQNVVGPAGDIGMSSGAAVADIDNDGFLDILIMRTGEPVQLFLNNGDGTFSDTARSAGIAGSQWQWGFSAGIVADLNGDGFPDIFLAGAGEQTDKLYINNGDLTFTDELEVRGIEPGTPLGDDSIVPRYGVSVADVNGDGSLDLLVLEWYTNIYSGDAAEVVRSVGESFSTDNPGTVTPCAVSKAVREAGFPGSEERRPSRSTLYLNDGTGHFRDGTAEFNLPLNEIVAFTGVFVDINDDGWPDLAITGDGCTSRLFLNEQGTSFRDITVEAGVGTDENGMGAIVKDLNGDGLNDWFITSIYYPSEEQGCPGTGVFSGCLGNRMYINNGDGTFTDETDTYGVRDGGWGWGVVAEDFNNNGLLDLVMTNGYDWELNEATSGDQEAARFYEHFRTDPLKFWILDHDEATYIDAASEVGVIDTSIAHALIAFDMDNDGDLDLISVASDAPTRLWRNDSDNSNSWIQIALDDPTTPGNRWGDGAKVVVTPKQGGESAARWITTTGSYQSQSPASLHVGLGAHASTIDEIRVVWPYGGEEQVLVDVEPNKLLTIQRGE